MFLKTIRFFFWIVLRLIANIKLIDFDRIPETETVVVVTNHLGRLDAMLGYILVDRADVIMMVAEKYEKVALWRWLGKKLDVIWINRFEPDIRALRETTRRLRQGGILAVAPEGTRSPTEALQEGKSGAVFLASKANAPIMPVVLWGTEDRVVKAQLRRFRRLDIVVRAGEPFTLPPMDRKNRDAYLQAQTEEIMCRIAALLPEQYRGVYADHPRLEELVEQSGRQAVE
ncbi:MAG: 1-acyl-sn-glycerol-3-phosphate acyltransferase [Chloroflexi bacterium]|nr:1-acyl-sn-glycerol-3-phosphate acyltransferase [Chloroflexota bacterium]